jgi:hypothetical protein
MSGGMSKKDEDDHSENSLHLPRRHLVNLTGARPFQDLRRRGPLHNDQRPPRGLLHAATALRRLGQSSQQIAMTTGWGAWKIPLTRTVGRP